MANIKSSAKRALIGKLRNERNKANRSALKTTIKKFDAAVAEGKGENAEAAYKAAVKSVDRAVSKGLIHKLSRCPLLLNTLSANLYLHRLSRGYGDM